jgi:hypothetical protein
MESIDIACFCDACAGNVRKMNNIVLPDACITVAREESEARDDYCCELIALIDFSLISLYLKFTYAG